jgi:hypothetical protein
MSRLAAFGRFWWDFVIGDDWLVAVLVVAGIGATAALATTSVAAWWLCRLPSSVCCGSRCGGRSARLKALAGAAIAATAGARRGASKRWKVSQRTGPEARIAVTGPPKPLRSVPVRSACPSASQKAANDA